MENFDFLVEKTEGFLCTINATLISGGPVCLTVFLMNMQKKPKGPLIGQQIKTPKQKLKKV
jgi:hypothetical protein